MIFAFLLALVGSVMPFAEGGAFNKFVLAFKAAAQQYSRKALDDSVNTSVYAGATVGVVLGVFVVLIAIYCIACKKPKNTQPEQHEAPLNA